MKKFKFIMSTVKLGFVEAKPRFARASGKVLLQGFAVSERSSVETSSVQFRILRQSAKSSSARLRLVGTEFRNGKAVQNAAGRQSLNGTEFRKSSKKYLFLQLLLWKYLNGSGTLSQNSQGSQQIRFLSEPNSTKVEKLRLNGTELRNSRPWIQFPTKTFLEKNDNFFSHRKSFFSYWLLPFFGFVGSMANFTNSGTEFHRARLSLDGTSFRNVCSLEKTAGLSSNQAQPGNRMSLEYGFKKALHLDGTREALPRRNEVPGYRNKSDNSYSFLEAAAERSSVETKPRKQSDLSEANYIASLAQRSRIDWEWNNWKTNGGNTFPAKIDILQKSVTELRSDAAEPRRAAILLDHLKLNASFLGTGSRVEAEPRTSEAFALQGVASTELRSAADLSKIDIVPLRHCKTILTNLQSYIDNIAEIQVLGHPELLSARLQNEVPSTQSLVNNTSLHNFIPMRLSPLGTTPWKMNHPILQGSFKTFFPQQTFKSSDKSIALSERSSAGSNVSEQRAYAVAWWEQRANEGQPRNANPQLLTSTIKAKTYVDLDRYLFYLHSKLKNFIIGYTKKQDEPMKHLGLGTSSTKRLRALQHFLPDDNATLFRAKVPKHQQRVFSIPRKNLKQTRKLEKVFRNYLSVLRKQSTKTNKTSSFFAALRKSVPAQSSDVVERVSSDRKQFLTKKSNWALQIMKLRSDEAKLRKAIAQTTSRKPDNSIKGQYKVETNFLRDVSSKGNLDEAMFHKCRNENQMLSLHLFREWIYSSPSVLLQNRSFLSFPKYRNILSESTENKEKQLDVLDLSRKNQEDLEENNATIEDIRKNQQKKRRLKKQRRETRRRKKRKRAFPRPLWLRYSLYDKFLKKRHTAKRSLILDLPKSQKEMVQLSLNSSKLCTDQQAQIYLNREFVLNDLSIYEEARNRLRVRDGVSTKLKPYFNKIKNSLKKLRTTYTPFPEALNSKASGFFKNESTSVNSKDFTKWEQAFFIANYYKNLSLRIQETIFSSMRHGLPMGPMGGFASTEQSSATANVSKSAAEFGSDHRSDMHTSKATRYSIPGRSKVRKNLFLDLKNKRKSIYSPRKRLFPTKPGLRTEWIFNKTNLFVSGASFKGSILNTQTPPTLREYSASNIRIKDIWTREKSRDQFKSNKTKKIFYQIQKKLSHLLFSTSTYSKPNFGSAKSGVALSASSASTLRSADLRTFKNKELKINYLLQSSNSRKFKFGEIPFSRYNKISNYGTDSIFQQHNPYSFWWQQQKPYLSLKSSSELRSYEAKPSKARVYNELSSETSSNLPIIICISMFHVCSLLSLITISQIRCVLKFYFLVFYKVSGTFYQIFFSLFNTIFTKSDLWLSSLFSGVRPGVPIAKLRPDETNEKKGIVRLLPDGTVSYTSETLFEQPRSKFLSGSKKRFLDIPILDYKRIELVRNSLLSSNSDVSYNEEYQTLIQYVSKNTTRLRRYGTKFREDKDLTTLEGSASRELGSATLLEYAIPTELGKFKRNLSLRREASSEQIFAAENPTELRSDEAKPRKARASQDTSSRVPRMFKKYSPNILIKKIQPFSKLRFIYKLYKKVSFFAFFSLVTVINIVESWLRLFYIFLEKPTEFIMDWIAQLFLIEWSSDLTPIIPDSLEYTLWNSFVKMTRSIRFLGPIGFLMERRLWSFFEVFLEILNQPDTDLIRRQKKGILFWDKWLDFIIKKTSTERRSDEGASRKTSTLSSDETEFNSLSQSLFLDKVEKADKLFEYEFVPAMLHPRKNDNSGTIGATRSIVGTSFRSETKTYELPHTSFTGVPSIGESAMELSNKSRNVWQEQIQKAKEFNKTDSLDDDFLITGEYNMMKWKRWAANQYFIFASKLQPDLFIDVHLPKSFQSSTKLLLSESLKERHFMNASQNTEICSDEVRNFVPTRQSLAKPRSDKWYGLNFRPELRSDNETTVWSAENLSAQASQENMRRKLLDSSTFTTTGNFICQIFSGIFLKQTAKNVLVIGSQQTDKTLLIKAIAGETELKMITDNANRYTLVINGLPVGIRLLKDVFDAIALHTPCLFLLEEIHVIGERRSSLITEDDNFSDPIFGSNNEEVHEKNQMLYSLSRHKLSYYKKPFKGSSYSNVNISKKDDRSYSKGAMHPLPLFGFEDSNAELRIESSNASGLNVKRSVLQLAKNKLLAPPATSPFSVLLMKEQKKFKPKKLVNEIPWSGLPMEQLVLLPRFSYSIKAKVLLLVEKAVENLYVKVNMITDLLLIIDSVRSNRGFIVFATTHIPSVLDPALRRPGRFDETISLPFVETDFNRWQTFSVYNNETSFYSNKQNAGVLNLAKKELRIQEFIPLRNGIPTSLSLASLRDDVPSRSIAELRSDEAKPRTVTGAASTELLFEEAKAGNVTNLKNLQQFDFIKHNSSESLGLRSFASSELSSPVKAETINSFINRQLKKGFAILRANSYTKITNILWNDVSSKHSFTNVNLLNQLIYPKELHKYRRNLRKKSTVRGSDSSENHSALGKIAPLFIEQYNSQQSTNIELQTFKETNNQNGTIEAGSDKYKSIFKFDGIHLTDKKSLVEIPSAPISRITLPSRRFENYKRAERDSQRTVKITIKEKMQMHQNQKMMRRLYGMLIQRDLKQNEKSNSISLDLDKKSNNPVSTNWFYKNKIYNRHRLHLVNQWWNGQLPEHNKEATFASDVDWRFVGPIVPGALAGKTNQDLKEDNNSNIEYNESELANLSVDVKMNYAIDFPDSEQYYNPKQRRWMLTTGYWSYWFGLEMIDKQTQSSLLSSETLQSSASKEDYSGRQQRMEINITEREKIDFLAFKLLEKGLLKEIDLYKKL